MPASNSLTFQLRLICANPPASEWDGQPVIFGLQDKKGALAEGEILPDDLVIFECKAKVKPGNPPNFLSPYAHGTPKDRFLYLSCRRAGDTAWIKRIKVPLSGITWEQIRSARCKILEATIDGSRAARVNVEWTSA
jgi:hypothetical protein